jgi:hypothetical protein
MTAHKKARRATRLGVWEAKFRGQLEPYGLIKHTDYHYAIHVAQGEAPPYDQERHWHRVDIWPSAGHWIYQGKSCHGGFDDLMRFLKKRGLVEGGWKP